MEVCVCAVLQMQTVGPTNDKEHGGLVGILKTEDGKPNNLNVSDFETAWNSTYMKNVRMQMLNGEQPISCIKNAIKKKLQVPSQCMGNRVLGPRVDPDKIIENTKEDGSKILQICIY